MGLLAWVGIVAGTGILLFVLQTVHLSTVLAWESEQSNGLGYYGRPPNERQRFKRTLRRHAVLLSPILRVMGRLSKFAFERASFRYRGVAGPKGTCSEASFDAAARYEARPEDVFVVTQMKCGTTWMQHVVYEVLHRGGGDLVASGRTLYGVCPWLEGLKSVPMDQAPLLGSERPSRVIKTHLPAPLCPRSSQARYVYVARHPVSCFASCVDFIATNAGRMAPDLASVEAWFRSPDAMWWGSWPDHVSGWWERSRSEPNVLFVYFEDMKRDLPATARRVADFLGMAPLTESELARVADKCGFDYMQRHQDAFEMNPPHLLQTDAELFVRGSADRHRDVPADARQRIAAWCAEQLTGSDFPLAAKYPDVVEQARTSG